MSERDWKPIETAPKDGTVILAWGNLTPKMKPEVTLVRWSKSPFEGRGAFVKYAMRLPVYATHWQPLPEPPLPTPSPQ